MAALTNSLYKQGFRGVIYAGYRGDLPDWASGATKRPIGKWTDASVLGVADGLQLVFLPLATDYHLTNYKPDFMLELLDGPATDIDAIYYFDPDICVVENWQFFEEWVTCGVALCEDVNSPLPEHHPRRVGWRRYFGDDGFDLKFRGAEYVNGGFVGLKATDVGFLKTWQSLQQAMASEIGGLKVSKIERGDSFKSKGFYSCFSASDQDALNAAIEAAGCTCSVIGKEVMGFKPGHALIPHALGKSKPWCVHYLSNSLFGNPPRLVDKLFWKNMSGPIQAFTIFRIRQKRLAILFAIIVGRFYKCSLQT